MLADGAATLDDAPGHQIIDHGAGQADGIDTEMTVETPVFRGHYGAQQMAGQLFQLYRFAINVTKLGNLPALIIQQGKGRLALDRG